MKYLKIIPILLFLVGCSCSKEDPTYSAGEMWDMAYKEDPTIELVFLSDTDLERHRRVLCSHYKAEGCVHGSGKRIKVRLVELLVIQYETSKQACLAALEVNQWHSRNWLFDDVTEEPVLESFVKKVFKAKKPKGQEDCE